MPAIYPKYDPNNKDINDAGNKERVARDKAIKLNWRYYDGDHFRWLKKEPGAVKDDNVILNLTGRATNKQVEFVGIPEQIHVPGDTDTETDTPLEKSLKEWWEANRATVPEIVQSGMIAGHNYLKLYWDTDGAPAYTLLDPCYMTVFWNAMNVKERLYYRLQWKQGSTAYRQDIVPLSLITPVGTQPVEAQDGTFLDEPLEPPVGWKIIDYEQKPSSKWEVLREQEWDFPFAPIVDWPHKRRPYSYYGESFVSGLINLNDGVNFVASNTTRIIKHHAHPHVFAFGVDLEGQNAVGGVWNNLPSDSRVELIEMGGDLASSMNMLALLRAELFSAARVLDLSTVKDKLGQITNFGVRMMFSEQIEAREEVTRLYGDAFAETYRRMAWMANGADPGKLETEWSEPLPVNRLEVLQAAEIESRLGTTSKKTLAESIDRDYEAEKELRDEETEGEGDMLTNILNRTNERGSGGLMNNSPRMNPMANANTQKMPMAS